MVATRQLDVTQLRAAIAVWRTGGVTPAAQVIGLTQPAVSRLITALEQEIDFAVFDRNRRRLVVTDRGASFLAEAEASLGSLARLSELAAELRRGERGLLRIAAVSVLAHGLAPRVLAALRTSFPNLVVEVEELDRAQQVEGLLSHHLDVGLVALPSEAPGLRAEMIAEGGAVCLLPAHHPMARHRVLTPALLANEPFVRLNEMRLMQQRVDDAFNRAGKSRLSSIAVNSTPLMIAFVAGGLGLAITHSLSTLSLPAGVVSRPFLPRLSFGYAALTRQTDKPSALQAQFVSLARRIAVEALADMESR